MESCGWTAKKHWGPCCHTASTESDGTTRAADRPAPMLSSSMLLPTACSKAMVPHALLMVCLMKYTSRSAASRSKPRSA